MVKKIFSLAISLIIFTSLFLGFSASSEGQEKITITTYYPSPYGMYNQLQSKRLAVGDINGDGNVSAADQPPADGQIYTARSVIYKPQSSLPFSDAREGELVYNNTDNKFYYYDGSAWVKQGGGGGCYISYSGGCLTGFTNMGSAGWWGNCEGNFAHTYFHFRPPGGGCGAGWNSHNISQAYVCCQ